MNRASRTAWIAVSVLTLFGASLASGTTVQKLSLKDLAKKSSSIVIAKVQDSDSRIDPSNKEIYTYITLRILEPVKGMKGEKSLTLRQLGGTVNHIASIVPGMPSFKKDEEVVLFLTDRDGAGYPWVMGLQQGKYTVTTDNNGMKTVRNELDGLRLLTPGGGQQEGAHVTKDMPLQAFLDGVKADVSDAAKVQVDPTPSNQ
jgi:hypothetical protein